MANTKARVPTCKIKTVKHTYVWHDNGFLIMMIAVVMQCTKTRINDPSLILTPPASSLEGRGDHFYTKSQTLTS